LTAIVRPFARGVVVGMLCASAGFAAAQSSPSPSRATLPLAVEAAWQRAIESVDAEGQVRRAGAERVAASAPWVAPPALELAHRDDRLLTDTGARETDVGIALPLWLPGQRDARRDAARAGGEAAVAGREAARLRVAGLVREGVWDVVLQRAEVALARARNDSLEALAADVDRRVAAGDLSRADALAARAEAVASAATLTQARTRLQVSLTRWRTLTGLADVPDAEPPLRLDAPRTLDVDHPLLRAARRNVELARARLEVVNRSRRSPPELLARMRTEVSSSAESSRNSIGIGIRLPLATEDRNAPLLAVANADLDLALATEQRLQWQLQADVEASRAEADTAELQIAEQQTRARLLREHATLVDKSFRAGETSLPEMLRVLSASAQADAALERQRAVAGLALARLRQALGIQP
jgi:cobalt-zinc-cadmium efflux system outer membrane protein